MTPHNPPAAPPPASSPERSLLGISMWGLIAFASFWGPLDVAAGAPKMTVGLDAKVAIKLLVFGLATLVGGYGLLSSAAVRHTLSTLPAMAITAILILAGLATPIAVSTASLPTALINFGTLTFMITALLTWKLRGVSLAILAGVTATTTLALSLWFLVPSYGVFPELLADGLVVNRLGGTSHPNGVGRAAVLGLILCVYFSRTKTLSPVPAGILISMFAFAAYLSWSRTAIMAGVAGIAILYLDRIFTRTGVLAISLAIVCGIGGLTVLYAQGKEDQLVGKVLSKISKSGDVEEITSGTGRSNIWSKAISLIANRPVIGHGFNAAPSLMVDHSQATHNAVLQATLAAGIGGGILMLSLMLWCLYLSIGSETLLIRSLAAFVVIASLAEDAVLETFPGPVTITFFVCCLYPVLIGANPMQHGGDELHSGEPATGELN